MNACKQRAADKKQGTGVWGLASAALEWPVFQGLFFLGREMVTIAALQASSLRPVTSQVTANSTAGVK